VAIESTPKRFKQSQLTKIFFEILGSPGTPRAGAISPLRTFHYNLWHNPKDENSLRLSLQGYNILKKNDIKSYLFELSEPLTNKNLLQLERHFPGMYFLFRAQKITVYDEQEASMLTLMDSNLKGYLDNLEESNT
jgi:hypothetical protein